MSSLFNYKNAYYNLGQIITKNIFRGQFEEKKFIKNLHWGYGTSSIVCDKLDTKEHSSMAKNMQSLCFVRALKNLLIIF